MTTLYFTLIMVVLPLLFIATAFYLSREEASPGTRESFEDML